MQGCQTTYGSAQVHLGRARFEALRSDAINGAQQLVIKVRVTTHARIEPIRHIQRTVHAHHHIRGAEERLQFIIHTAATAFEICSSKLPLGIRGQEIKTLQLVARAIGLGMVAENGIAPRLAGQE